MEIQVDRTFAYDKIPVSKEELEKAACNSLEDCVEFFRTNNIRFGEKGLYMVIEDRVVLFTVDINYVGEVPWDDVEVAFEKH